METDVLIRPVRGAFTIIRGATPVSPSNLTIPQDDWKAYETCVPHFLSFSDALRLSYPSIYVARICTIPESRCKEIYIIYYYLRELEYTINHP
jgi:hypothetical protein